MLLKYLLIPVILIVTYSELTAVQKPDSKAKKLLKEASNIGDKNPSAAISKAELAARYAFAEKDPITEIQGFSRIAEFYWQKKDYQKASAYALKALSISEKNKIDSLAGYANILAGIIYYSQTDLSKALMAYQRAATYYLKTGKKTHLAIAYLNTGLCQRKMGRFRSANETLFKAADIFQSLGDEENLSDVYNSIGINYASLKFLNQAIKYHHLALNIRKKAGQQLLIAESYNNLGYTFKKNHVADSAIYYLNRCLSIRETFSDSSLLILPLQNLGSSYQQKGNIEMARQMIMRSLIIAQKYNMSEEFARGNLDMAELYRASGDYGNAMRSVTITEQNKIIQSIPEILSETYSEKARLYHLMGNHRQAFAYLQKYNSIKDSIFISSNNNAIAELEISYQTRQKERDLAAMHRTNQLQIQILDQKNLLIAGLAISVALLMGFGCAVFYFYRQKNLANQKITTLMQDLHHRVKNNLQILSGLFSMQLNENYDENTRSALRENESRLTSMNLIHNKLYYNDNDTQIEMQEYLNELLLHIKGSFGNDRTKQVLLNINVPQLKLEAEKAVAIGLIVNELVTNSFKYAFNGAPGEIYLSLSKKSDRSLQMYIGDNGTGIGSKGEQKTGSFGLKLVNLMARQLNANLTEVSGSGTAYTIDIEL